MLDKSPKGCKPCWRNSACWSANSPAATKLGQGGGEEEVTWIESCNVVTSIEIPHPRVYSRAYFPSSLLFLSLSRFFEAIGNNWLVIWNFLFTFALSLFLSIRWAFHENRANVINRSFGLFREFFHIFSYFFIFSRLEGFLRLSSFEITRGGAISNIYLVIPHTLNVFVCTFCYRDSLTHIF